MSGTNPIIVQSFVLDSSTGIRRQTVNGHKHITNGLTVKQAPTTPTYGQVGVLTTQMAAGANPFGAHVITVVVRVLCRQASHNQPPQL